MTLFLPFVRITFLSCRCGPISRCSLRASRALSGWLYSPSRSFGSDKNNEKSLSKVKSRSEVGTATTLEQVKETTKTASYWGIFLAGFGLTGVLFYAVFNELFSSKSPSSVYGGALKRCSHDPRIIDALGEPLRGFGEETRRGRRRHVRMKKINLSTGTCLCN
ncbi:mitochondrial import inner membrane translocase subunit Tim21 isoform X2 [Bacillus rossius redtenbacheri]|uniref:mitochondrial import inner membrane translocase subunit Tim21 isoform X2 n=1 Tax=Bacillus rossius redtenbacheri TaxID=93214 RepID=UPI002FDD3D25